MKTHPHVYRIEPRTPGRSPAWQVQIRHNGKVKAKTFADRKFGGEKSALNEASERNPDGYRRKEACWQAYWTDKSGKQVTRRFSVNQLGEEAAKQAALAVRKKAEAALSRGDDPVIEVPANPKAILWRYMDFTKFLSLLEDSSLFFSAAANFEDPYEGTYSQANKLRRSFVMSRGESPPGHGGPTSPSRIVLSCWYAAQHESAAM